MDLILSSDLSQSVDQLIMSTTWKPAEGGCPCRTIRYRLDNCPLVTHWCHCTNCQQETGSAFAINLWIEAKDLVLLTDASTVKVPIATPSGDGQTMYNCPKCQVTVWTVYGADDGMRWVRAGSLDDPSVAPPDVQIWTRSKMPWVKLNEDIPVREKYYDRNEIWSKSSLERWRKLKEGTT